MTYILHSIHLCFFPHATVSWLFTAAQSTYTVHPREYSTPRLRHTGTYPDRKQRTTSVITLSLTIMHKEPTRSYCTSNSRAVGTIHARADDNVKRHSTLPMLPSRTHCLARSTQEGNQRQPSWRMSFIAVPLQTHAQIAPHRSTNDWSSPSLVTS